MSKKDSVTDTIGGIDVTDPYRWLEESSDPEVKEWVKSQNDRIETEIQDDQYEKISDELVANYQTTNFSTPKYVNGRYVYMERKPDQDQHVLYVKKSAEADPQTVFDPNGKKEENTLAITYWTVSQTGRFVSFGVSEDGNEMATLRVYDVENDSMLDDAIINCRFASTTWLSDDSGFYYVRNPRPGEVPEGETHMHPKVYFHTLGDDPENDELIFGEDRPKEDMPKIGISPDDSYLSIRVGQDWTENDIFIYEIDTGEITKIINGDGFYSGILFLQDKAILE
ncbi:MAG: hypothetical protein BRC24_00755 [Parcubacteria group bacterium SW_4_46_8]|nr:MAG: hypothetical protein BRC24_00755 [Parcubacteria group bacterium SW_4_46_8]